MKLPSLALAMSAPTAAIQTESKLLTENNPAQVRPAARPAPPQRPRPHPNCFPTPPAEPPPSVPGAPRG